MHKKLRKGALVFVAPLVVTICLKLASCADEPSYSRRTSSIDTSYPRTSGALYPRRTSTGLAGPYQRRTSKTVVTRPAMRLHRYRPSTRRRIHITGRPAGTGFRRVVIHSGSAYRSRYGNAKETTASVRTTTAEAKTTPTMVNVEKALQDNATISPSESTITEAITAVSNSTTAQSASGKQLPTTASRNKPTRNRNMKEFYSLRQFDKETSVDYNDLAKKLDYFMAYYPSVRETASRLSNLLTRQEQTSREERRRIWKGVFRVRSDLRIVNAKCERMHRNITAVLARTVRQTKEFESYQEANKKKIEQIEIHQGRQDERYFEVYQRLTNNTKEIERFDADMTVLLPLVSNLLENYERSTQQEKMALEMLDSHARGNIADMTNQILVQQNTLANLGNQVRTEMDLLHAEKQSMAKSVEQHNRRLVETVNSHLSSHVKQMNVLEGSLNRQAENIKYITTVVTRHDEMLDSNHVFGGTFLDQIANISEGLRKMEANVSRYARGYQRAESGLNDTKQTMEKLEASTRHLVASLNSQHQVIAQTIGRLDDTEAATRAVSSDLEAYKVNQDAETGKLRDDVNDALESQRNHQNNISRLLSWREAPLGRGAAPHYPSDEPAPEPAPFSLQEFKSLLTEVGVDDRMSRLTRVLRHQQQRMSNVTRAVLRIAEDNQVITERTTQYFDLINSQSKVIRDQNETISKLAMIATKQDNTIMQLSGDLTVEQEMVIKLTHILANIASQFKSPVLSQRDCHDVWLNGNRDSGVYNIIEDMTTRPVLCNLTSHGGWTIIQRRRDGSQDFDRTMQEYQKGFGDIYGEYWLGLDSITMLTQKVRPTVALQVVLEDWEGQIRTATYSHFHLYGKTYRLAVSGYEGDAGDSLSQANGFPFSAKRESGGHSGGACSKRRNAGWWFASPQQDCGESSLNGVYREGPAQDARVSSTIYWKKWRGVGYPLKGVTIQIMPADALKNLQSAMDAEATGPLDDSDSIEEQPPDEAPERAPSLPYEEALEKTDPGDRSQTTDYDNFDYNILLNDG